jgi:hypothetical protein
MTTRGVPPKHPSTRQRRNKVTTATTLALVDNPKVPLIPKRGPGLQWQPETVKWWHRTWSSPMSSEYDESDYSGIVRRLFLEDAYWYAMKNGMTLAAFKFAAEIRIQDTEYGLTPMARRRLQWSIEQAESAEEKTEARRKSKRAASGPKPVDEVDPRAMLA